MPILKEMISIIIPVFNEEENVKDLIKRIDISLKNNYEIILIDDHSTDNTLKVLTKLKSKFPIRIFPKEGQQGKAYSLVEGFEKAKGEILAMIDADLQYPPEAIPQLENTLKDSDLVVADRKNYKHSKIRKLASRTFRLFFGKSLFGLNTDIQSGLKVFKREVWETVKFTPRSAWTFDLEFLHRAKEAGFTIGNSHITFHPRTKGNSKLALLAQTWEIGSHALLLKTKKIGPVLITPTQKGTMRGAGMGFKKHRYIIHSTLSHERSALTTTTTFQKILILLVFSIVSASFFIDAKQTAIALVGVLTSIYFADVLFNAYLITKSLKSSPEISFTEDKLAAINEKQLPTYTVLCPLYKEADILPQFSSSIESLDWPKNKLEVLLLLEQDDVATIKVAKNLSLPDYFKVIVVPNSNPKTKPKACNYGLNFATGKYIVIYDAEDRPDPLQLKKAFLAFEKFGNKVACFQAKLNYYNSKHNWLTRFFTAEYSLWFGLILAGLQSLNTSLPLGGTSNHFKTDVLRKLKGWDPFNVTEDCDLGVRLFRDGYKTAMIDSITLEEANSKVGNWLRQRSRWIKGYIQTYLVHNRDFAGFVKTNKTHAGIFQLIVGGKIAFIMINPFMWATTIAYFAFRSTIGPTIESFFPTSIFYMAVFCLVAGNFLYLYYYMIALAKHEKFDLIKYVLFIPVYWFMISTAFWIAAYQLIFKPHFWEKTVHGFHIQYEKKLKEKAELKVKAEETREERIRKIRTLIGSGTAAGGFLVVASIIGNFLNFLYNAYLARAVSIEDFGLVSLIGSFLFLSTIPLTALSKSVSHKSAYLLGKYQTAIKDFWRFNRRRSILLGLTVTVIWTLATPFLVNFFKAPAWDPFILFAPVWVIGAASAIDRGFIGGNLKFKILGILVVSEAFTKLLFTWFLVSFGFPRFIYAAIPASMFVAYAIGWFFASGIKEEKVEIENKKILKFPNNFFISSVLTKFSSVAFISFDLLLAKHYLPPKEAGQYALISLIGKMIFLVGGLFSQFIIPIISHEEGASGKTKHVFGKIFLASVTVSFITYLFVGFFGFITAPLLFGESIREVSHLLPFYGLAMFCFTTASIIVSFHQVKSQHLFAHISFILAILQIAGILLFHSNINEIVLVMTIVGVANLSIVLIAHSFYKTLDTIIRNATDFLSIFSPFPTIPEKSINGRRILIFNWRDTKHKWAGGAEVYIHEVAKRLVKEGSLVTLFCGNDGHSRRNETIDGIRIVRRGGFYTVYLWAFLYYIFRFNGDCDLIIDSENGIPFFTPLYTRKPIIGLVHHVHQEVFRGNLIWPLAVLGKFLEGKVMPFVYKDTKMITVSQSSKEALEEIGLGKRESIEIINPGVDLSKFKPMAKTKEPSILYLGRLKPYKSVDTIIKAMTRIIKKLPQTTFTIAGDGESRKTLERLTSELGLEKAVKFIGKVSEKTKAELFAKSWVVVQPSSIEGWGITAIEANASGTPVVASNVPGLRDSVKNPSTGYLVTWGKHEKFAEKITLLISNKKLRKEFERYSLEWAKQFSWEKSGDGFLKIIEEELKKERLEPAIETN